MGIWWRGVPASTTPAADDVARRFSQAMGRASAGEVSAEQLQELTDEAAAALPSFTADHVSIVLLSLAHLAHDPGERHHIPPCAAVHTSRWAWRSGVRADASAMSQVKSSCGARARR